MTAGGALLLISSTVSEVPSRNAIRASLSPESQQRKQVEHCSVSIRSSSRRNVVFLSLLSLAPSIAEPAPAAGPKEWLREQKKKASRFLLAPIDASRESLRNAYLMLTATGSQFEEDLVEIQRLTRSAARDCVPQDRNSFVSFQANTGVEVCTFRLIVKNASSLLDDKDPVKLEAEAMLTDLVRSFTSLDGATKDADLQLASSRQNVANLVKDVISSLDKFEQSIKNCLEV